MKKIWKHLFNQNMLYILLMLVQMRVLERRVHYQ